MVALQQDRPRAVGAVEAGPGATIAEVPDVPAVLRAELDAQLRRLVRIFVVEPLECLAVGLAETDVLILVYLLVIPDQ